MSARFLVGIDLGTTHTVVAYAALPDADAEGVAADRKPQITLFELPQLVAPGEVSALPLLPSFRYQSAAGELSQGDYQLPWSAPQAATTKAESPPEVVGNLALRLGTKVPGRLIASAKSWLSHDGVDRQAPILPWGAPEEVERISPVDASASYLMHVRQAWDHAHPAAPLAAQQVVLTVPASFDEVARTLTVVAAHRAGLPQIRLLEEPQAAFYDWLNRHEVGVGDALREVRLAVVLDVGGGTTDLTLIQVTQTSQGTQLTRIAVGDHLMLGGDNMDVGLARTVESQLLQSGGPRLTAAQFSQLVQQCRKAKEQLLSLSGPDEVRVTLLGGGSKLVGGARSAMLKRAEVLSWVLDGFAPAVKLTERPKTRTGALVEFGLPYASDPAITRHLAAFLSRHAEAAKEALGAAPGAAALPDAVLFNGGVFRSARLRQRMLDVLADFSGSPPRTLDNEAPDLAVARGAVAYGLARRGVGLRIGGGSSRGYFVALESEGDEQKGVCVLPRGTEEGEDVSLEGRHFALRMGVPVRFALWTHSAERGHRPGDVVSLSGQDFAQLPAVATVIESGEQTHGELKVELHATLTEVGTLEISCVSVEQPTKRYRLEFQLRGDTQAPDSVGALPITELHPRFEEAAAVVRVYYGKSDKRFENRKVKALRAELEKLLGERNSWDTALLRELFGVFLSGMKRRFRSADHERLWLNFVGYCLRPGLGYPLDEWRVEQVWNIYDHGVQHAQQAAVWSQWWILWRRIAGGLDTQHQEQIADRIAYYLEPTNRPRPRPKGPRALAVEDMARLAGALERLPAERKVQFGTWLLARMERGELPKTVWWSIGRLGARAPLYGSAHSVVPPDIAEQWLRKALAENFSQVDQAPLAAAQLARLTADRARDLSQAARDKAAQQLARAKAYSGWIDLIQQGGDLSADDQARVLGDALPAGLKLI